jgi:hypothetical protein
MKCLSLWQPWATLMWLRLKFNETRSWETLYRGPLAIHAAKTWNRELAGMICEPEFKAALEEMWPGYMSAFDFGKNVLPRGSILCVVNLDKCVRITDKNAPPPGTNERAFGDYTPGRFAWCTSNARQLREPLPWKGAQGLFDVQDEVILPLLEAA